VPQKGLFALSPMAILPKSLLRLLIKRYKLYNIKNNYFFNFILMFVLYY